MQDIQYIQRDVKGGSIGWGCQWKKGSLRFVCHCLWREQQIKNEHLSAISPRVAGLLAGVA